MSDVVFPGNTGRVGAKRSKDGFARFNVISFVVNQILAGISTAMVVEVIKVTPGAGILPGLVSIQPAVNQLDGGGNPMPHGIIFNIPYIRVQGGPNAVICDPVAGDTGLAIFAQRDISLVKKASSLAPLFGLSSGTLPVNPGSRRRFDMADGIYIGGWGNAAPRQALQFTSTGINIFDINGNTIVMNASGITITDLAGHIITLSSAGITLTATTTTVTNNLVVDGTMTGKAGSGSSVGLTTHTHPDPQGGNSGSPNPGS